MYKKIIYKSVLILALVLSSSCNKYLTLYPQDGIVREEFWQNKEQVSSAVIGVYSSLIAPAASKSDRSLAELLFDWGELRADNVAPGTSPANDELNLMTGNVLATNTICQWAAVYRTINLCNTVLDFAPAVLGKDPTFTQTKLNQQLAEVLTIRALMYFYLVRSFRDAPLKLTSTSSDSDLAQLAKTSSTVILAQIVKDLTTAEQSAVFTYGNIASDKGRITRFTVNAIQADVYLWMEDYQNCITACEKIKQSNNFGLIAGDSGFFTNLYYNGNSNESIFEFQFDNQALNTFYTLFTTRVIASASLSNEVFPINFNDLHDVDIRSSIAFNAGNSFIYKYISINANTFRTPDISYAHWIVYRYADILLMEAEAYAWTNQGAQALQLIRTIRDRARASVTTLETPDPSDQQGVSQYVLDERDREFAFEGKRWYDLLRNAKRGNFQNIGILTNPIAANAPKASQQSIVAKLQDPNFLYFPIYNGDLILDPNLVQNPFYR